MSTLRASSPLIGCLKWICAQVIVAHHLASYGPFAEWGHAEVPKVFDAFSNYGAWVVSAFLVISGFLTAQAIHGELTHSRPLWRCVMRRYLRLAPMYYFAIAMSVSAAFICRPWLMGEMVPSHPGVLSFLAHFLLLQDIVGFDALSAGLWYVSIDLQLFALFLGLHASLRISGRRCLDKSASVAWATVGLCSLFYFNRSAQWDVWAVYYAGIYALGALTYNAFVSNRNKTIYFLFLIAALLAWWVDPRPRLLVGIAVSWMMYEVHQFKVQPNLVTNLFRKAGEYSYPLFLSHYAILMLFNLCFQLFDKNFQDIGLWLFLIIMICNSSGWLVWRYIDIPAKKWLHNFYLGSHSR